MFCIYVPRLDDYIVKIIGADSEDANIFLICEMEKGEKAKITPTELDFCFKNFSIPF
jgi:hypothetical protein